MNSNMKGLKEMSNGRKVSLIGSRAMALALVMLGIASCKNKDAASELEAAKGEYVTEKNYVDTMVLRNTSFNLEIVSNGNLRAVKKADMVFNNSGMIAKVYKKNGDNVRKGDTIVALDRTLLKMKLNQAQISMEKATLDFSDNLLGFGYGKDTANIPDDIVRIAQIRSGYLNAKHDLATAKMDLANAAIVAPFSGVVANCTVKPYEQSKDVVCSIIDNSTFDVEFNLLESELNYVKPGQGVKVVPYIDANSTYSGTVKEVNPMVDDKGQVRVVASIVNKGGKLIEGMNVKIFIESKSHNKLVVPKSSVVVRDGYDVLFTYNEGSSKAEWVYVDILESNSTQHVVRGNEQKNAELNPGAIVITSGNLNLAEGSRVEIKR